MCNFHPLEVVGCGSETQLQMSENVVMIIPFYVGSHSVMIIPFYVGRHSEKKSNILFCQLLLLIL